MIVERAADQAATHGRDQVHDDMEAGRNRAHRQPDEHRQPIDAIADVGREFRGA